MFTTLVEVRLRRDVSADISVHSEREGLIGIQDNRNGNLVIATYMEARSLIVILGDLLDELELNDEG